MIWFSSSWAGYSSEHTGEFDIIPCILVLTPNNVPGGRSLYVPGDGSDFIAGEQEINRQLLNFTSTAVTINYVQKKYLISSQYPHADCVCIRWNGVYTYLDHSSTRAAQTGSTHGKWTCAPTRNSSAVVGHQNTEEAGGNGSKDRRSPHTNKHLHILP